MSAVVIDIPDCQNLTQKGLGAPVRRTSVVLVCFGHIQIVFEALTDSPEPREESVMSLCNFIHPRNVHVVLPDIKALAG